MNGSSDTNSILFPASKAICFLLCHATSQVYRWTGIMYVIYFVIACNKVINVKKEMKIGGCGE